jgi:hypothetical protein
MVTKLKFSNDRVRSLTCEPGKQQSFYRDERQPGLGLRFRETGLVRAKSTFPLDHLTAAGPVPARLAVATLPLAFD